MALLNLLFNTPRPGWMTRDYGRRFVEVCLVSFDIVVEGLYQGRLALFGVEPPTDAMPRMARDRGIVPGIWESARSYALRLRRWRWSWRAAGLPGVADVVLDCTQWSGNSPTPTGRPMEDVSYILHVVTSGVVGSGDIEYQLTVDGVTGPVTSLGFATTLTIGDLVLTWQNGDVWNSFDEMHFRHGGRGLLLNELGAPNRKMPAASPAGDEGILNEIAGILLPKTTRIRLISADGTWWTREANGYVWRLMGGPWGWEAEKDADPSYWARGLIVIDAPEGVDHWEVMGATTHNLGEPFAVFGVNTGIEFWNRMRVTVSNFNARHMLVLSTILNFDPTKFNPSDPSTCPQDNWHEPGQIDSAGHVTASRPIEYAWFCTLQ